MLKFWIFVARQVLVTKSNKNCINLTTFSFSTFFVSEAVITGEIDASWSAHSVVDLLLRGQIWFVSVSVLWYCWEGAKCLGSVGESVWLRSVLAKNRFDFRNSAKFWFCHASHLKGYFLELFVIWVSSFPPALWVCLWPSVLPLLSWLQSLWAIQGTSPSRMFLVSDFLYKDAKQWGETISRMRD